MPDWMLITQGRSNLKSSVLPSDFLRATLFFRRPYERIIGKIILKSFDGTLSYSSADSFLTDRLR